MPDVGILNLQIHDDSAKAAEGLSKLVAKLEEMKNATSKIRLGTVATGIKRINDELSKVQPSAIYKLKQLADVLEKIGSISGNVGGIRISFGGKGQSAEEINASMQAAREAAAQTSSMFESIGQRIQEDVTGVRGFAGEVEKLNNLVQQTGWTAQFTAEQFAQMFQVANSIRMSGALGGGASPFALGDGTGGSGADWTYWKDGAIEVEGTVTEAMDAIRIGANDAIIPMSGIVESASEMSSSFETVDSSVQNISSNADQIKSMATGFEDVAQSTRDAARETANYYKSLEDAFYGIRNGKQVQNDLMSRWLHGEGTANEQNYAIKTMARTFGMTADEVKEKLIELTQAETAAKQAETGLQQGEIQTGLDGVADSAKEASKSFSELMFGAQGLKGAFSRMFPTISGLAKRFGQLLKYRMLRAVIKQIAEGFKVGYENYYHYSEAIGGSFAPAMDSAASSLLQMKNSIGAAVAPLMQSLVPVLQTVVNFFVGLINYANQFFALMRGQSTWSRATNQSTKAFEDTKKSAKGAGGAIKDLLASWDELNIIQSESGGSGAGGAAKAVEDYAGMFEEVGKFDSELQGIVAGIKEEFGSIGNLAKKIGIALLGWKISNAFAGILGTLGGLLSALGIIDLEFHISTLLNNRYLETGEVGYLVADLLQTLLGGVLMKKVLGNVLGGSLASLAIPIVFTVSAIGGIKALVTNTDVSALSEEGILSALNTAIKGGAAAGGLLYSLAGLTLGTSLGVGAGAALFTFGATIGIKAIADTIDAGAITRDTIKANLLSAGTIGAGLALTEAILGGTAATIATVGLGGALLTLGALFAIEAVIASKPKNVRWGSYKATEKEIKAFVEGEVFTVSPNTIISVMNPVIQLSKEKDEALTASVDEVKLTVAKLTIGINNESDTLSSLEEQIFGNSETGTQGLIGKFNESVRQKQSVIETGILIEPVVTEGDNGEAKQIIDESSEGWKKLTEHMGDLGKRLSEHIAEAYKEGITDEARAMELRTIQELTGMMANVSAAITQGEAEEKAFRVLNEQLTGLTQGSWDQMFAYIEEYKAGITSAYTNAYDAVTDAMAGEVAGLRQSMENALELAGGNENDAKYKEYKAEYDRMKERLDARRAGRDKAIDDYADKAMNTETMARIREMLSGMIDKGAIDMTDINSLGLQDIVGGPEFMNTIWKTLFDEHGIDKGGAKEQMSTWFDRLIDAAFGSDAETIKNAIKIGFLDYGDVISKDVIDQFANVIGITDSSELVNAWNELINSMLIQGDSDTPVYDLELGVDSDVSEPIQAPGVDSSSFNSSLIDMQKSAKSAVDYIKSVIESLSNFSVNVSVTERNKAPEGGLPRYMQTRASGGFVRSGDLVMANENGNFEMMGRMGNQPVVANNQQIVNGISQGVAQANNGMESRLGTIETLLNRILNKEFTAKAIPNAAWGNHNSKSNSAWDRVTGNA